MKKYSAPGRTGTGCFADTTARFLLLLLPFLPSLLPSAFCLSLPPLLHSAFCLLPFPTPRHSACAHAAARHTRASHSYQTACHVHFLWLAAKMTAQERQFRQLHPSRPIHAPRVRRQNACTTLRVNFLETPTPRYADTASLLAPPSCFFLMAPEQTTRYGALPAGCVPRIHEASMPHL